MSVKLQVFESARKQRSVKLSSALDKFPNPSQPISAFALQTSPQGQMMSPSLKHATIIQLQQQCGNTCISQLLASSTPQESSHFDPNLAQRQDFGEEETWDDEEGEEEPVENEECLEQEKTLKEAFAAKAQLLERGDVDSEFQVFKEDVNGYIGNWQGAETEFTVKNEALQESESRIETIQKEIERRSAEEYEEEFAAVLADLQAQYAAKESERDAAKALFQSKEAELQATVQSALAQFAELPGLVEELKDYHFSIDMTMALEYAEGQEPTKTLEKIEMYKQLQQELETKIKQLDEKYQANLEPYEALGQAVEAAEQDYFQKEKDLIDLANQLAAHEQLSLQAKQEELTQEEAEKEVLAEEQKAAKKERAGYLKGTEFNNYFSHLEGIGVGLSSSDWNILANVVEQYRDACPTEP